MATRTETEGLLSINAIEAVEKAVEEVRRMAENEKREREEEVKAALRDVNIAEAAETDVTDDEDKDAFGCFGGVEEIVPGKKNIYELLHDEIMESDLTDAEKNERLSKLLQTQAKKVNIIFVGATGSGKSSTVNALFNMEVAKVGVGADPETAEITKYELGNLTIWDTPGLGDGERDEGYNRMIVRKLNELDEDGNPLIDLVVVVLDASSRDLKTSCELIKDVVIPCMGKDNPERILVALNQSDVAMKGKHWDAEKNVPDEVLKKFLKEKAESVSRRVKEATGLNIKPICYCAGYKEEGETQCAPYNLTKLLYYIVKSVPKDKRLALADNINTDKDKWLYDDEQEDYKEGFKRGLFDTVYDCVWENAYDGGELGETLLGIPGRVIGSVVGAGTGIIRGFFESIFG